MEPPPFSRMNREERHLCAIFYHLLTDVENLRAFQAILGLEPRTDTEVFIEAAFVRDYFHWWRNHFRSRRDPRGFDDFCHKAFAIRPRQPPDVRDRKGFLSLRALWGKRDAFDDPYCALLPRLLNMRFDVLLLTPHTFAVIETKLHSPLKAEQMYLQQVLGKILSRLPGYDGHTFRHFLVSTGKHPKLEDQVTRQKGPPLHSFHLERRSWAQLLGTNGLPRIAPRQRKEVGDMLGPKAGTLTKLRVSTRRVVE